MDDGLLEENIRTFRRALVEASDEEHRRVLLVLLQLLVAEQAPVPTTSQDSGWRG
jgi:hypothetical protein